MSKPSRSDPLPIPVDILFFEILIRLPVKTLVAFKLVSKNWLAQLSNPTFIHSHRTRTSQNPNNNSLFITNGSKTKLIHIINGSIPLDPVLISNIFRNIVGSVNGLVCSSQNNNHHAHHSLIWNPDTRRMKQIPQNNHHAHHSLIWNPATRRMKRIPHPPTFGFKHNRSHPISVGFGYDPVADDYKIIHLSLTKSAYEKGPTELCTEVFSCNAERWKFVNSDESIHMHGFSFSEKCNLVVKGTPYWLVSSKRNRSPDTLVAFDAHTEAFKQFQLPGSKVGRNKAGIRIINWMDSVGVVEYDSINVDVAVYTLTESCGTWIKLYDVQVFPNHWISLCLSNGDLVVESRNRKLSLVDSETSEFKDLAPKVLSRFSSEFVSYKESLVYVNGMEQVEKEVDGTSEGNEAREEEEEDDDN